LRDHQHLVQQWRPARPLLYLCNNIVQYGSVGVTPFATGMFMLFEAAEFDRLGGFHEGALYAKTTCSARR